MRCSLAPHRYHIHLSSAEITASISQRAGEEICCSIAITPPIILDLITKPTVKWVSFRQKRKHFFFEKKKQKTFEFLNALAGANETQETKVFWFFFFKKEHLPFLVTYLDDRLVAQQFAADIVTPKWWGAEEQPMLL